MEFLYETHMHTSEVSACARATAEQQVVLYKKMGYTGVIITDHFINGYTTCPKKFPWKKKMEFFVSGYENAKKAGDMCGLDVFLGWEFTIRGSDFLTYGLDLDFLLENPDVDKLEIDDYSRLVRESGGFLAQAHPYRDEHYIENPFPVDPCYIDAVEVFNAMDKDISNYRTREYADENNLPVQAGTDFHGRSFNLFSGIKLHKKAESIHDIIDAIVNRQVDLLQLQYASLYHDLMI